jgi:PTS system fructose-specific IIC component
MGSPPCSRVPETIHYEPKPMTKIVAITASNASAAHAEMAAESLKRVATARGHDLKAEAQAGGGTVTTTLSPADIQDAEVVIVGADQFLERGRFAGKPVYAVSTSEAIRNTDMVIQNAVALVDQLPNLANLPTTPHPHDPLPEARPDLELSQNRDHTGDAGAATATGEKFFVGITSCPTGIAHTFMAAEALKQGATSWATTSRSKPRGPLARKTSLPTKKLPVPMR